MKIDERYISKTWGSEGRLLVPKPPKLDVAPIIGTNSRPLPKRRHGVLLIIGDGANAKEDIQGALGLVKYREELDVFAICRALDLYPLWQVLHWGTGDPGDWLWYAGTLPKHIVRHTSVVPNFDDAEEPNFDVLWPLYAPEYYGTSAMMATIIGLNLGYPKIVLAGCPLDDGPHWYDGPDDEHRLEPDEYLPAWLNFATTEESLRVRSMSGNTETLLGRPDKAWLKT